MVLIPQVMVIRAGPPRPVDRADRSVGEGVADDAVEGLDAVFQPIFFPSR